MEFIEYNIGRLLRCYFVQLRLRATHQFGVGIKVNVCQRKIRVVPFQAFQLGLKDIFTGRKPDHDLLRVVLDQLERNIALSGAGRMNNGRQLIGAAQGKLIVTAAQNLLPLVIGIAVLKSCQILEHAAHADTS